MRQPFLWATYPSRLHSREIERATLFPDVDIRRTRPTWSCTRRGFSCGANGAIACATIVIADNAVVSYTTFSPVSRFLLVKKPGCVFSVILSVPAGYGLQDPRFLRSMRTREASCPVVFGLSSPSRLHGIERLPDTPASASGPNVQPSQQNSNKRANHLPTKKFTLSNVFLYRCRGSPIDLLLDFFHAAHI